MADASNFKKWDRQSTVADSGAVGLPASMSDAPPAPPVASAGPGILNALKKGWIAPRESIGTIEPWRWRPPQEWAASTAEQRALLGSPPPTPPAGVYPGPLVMEPTEYERLPDPSNTLERVAYDVTSNAPSLVGGAIAAPVFGAMAGVPAVPSIVTEIAASLGGLSAARMVEEAGGGPWAQSAADVTTAMSMPAAIPIAAGRSANRVVGRLARAPEGAIEASEQVANYMSRRYGDGGGGRPPDASDAYEAAIQTQRQFPLGVRDPGKFRERAVARIEDTQRQFPDPDAQPSLAQTMSGPGTEDLGGYNVARRELQYAKADPDYARSAYGRRLETQEWVEEAYQREMPEFAGYTTTRANAQKILDDAELDARLKWEQVPLEDMPMVPADDLLEEVAKMEADLPGLPYLPREVKAIKALAEQNGGRIPYPMLQSLASELSTTVRAGDAAGPLSELAWRRAGRARRLQQIVEPMLDSADPGDVMALRNARAATRRAKELRTPVIQEIIRNDDPVDVLNMIKRADDIGETTRQVRAILGEDNIGGLRSAAWHEIFGDNIGAKNATAMRNMLRNRNNKQLFEALFEPEQLAVIEDTINRWARASQGKAATAAQAASTGTGYSVPVESALEAMQGGRGSMTAQTIAALRRGYRKLGEATPQSMSIEKLASQDIELARLLLKVPTPENISALANVYQQALMRAQRAAPNSFATTTGALAGARRVHDSNLVMPTADEVELLRRLKNAPR